MRYHLVSLLFLAALKSSHSWQTQLPPTRRKSHWRSSSSSSSTRLDFSMGDVDTMTALTTSLVIGGTLFLTNQMAFQERAQKAARQMPNHEKEQVMVETKENESTQMVSVVKEERPTMEQDEDVKTGSSAIETSIPVPVSEASTVESVTAVLDTPEETTDSIQPIMSNIHTVKEVENRLEVEEPTVDLSDKQQPENDSPPDKTDAEPSFISYLESPSKNGSENRPTEVKENKTKPLTSGIAPDQVRKNKPFQANTTPKPSISSSTATSKETKVEPVVSVSTSVHEAAVQETAKGKEPVTTASTPTIPKSDTTTKAQEQVTSVSSTTDNLSMDTSRGKEPTSISASIPATNALEQRKALSGDATKSPHQHSKHSQPTSTTDLLKHISRPATSTNAKTRLVTTSSTATRKKTTTRRNEDENTSLRSTLSLLANAAEPSDLNDEDAEFVSLQEYIQNQARDMTLKRMGDKIDWLNTDDEERVLQHAAAKEKTNLLDDDAMALASDSEDLLVNTAMPVFFAPVVDDPYAEMKETKFASASLVSTETDAVEKTAAISTSESEEEVAKSLKKRSNPSLTKKARQSALLVAMVTGMVVVGKRLATIAIGRGML